MSVLMLVLFPFKHSTVTMNWANHDKQNSRLKRTPRCKRKSNSVKLLMRSIIQHIVVTAKKQFFGDRRCYLLQHPSKLAFMHCSELRWWSTLNGHKTADVTVTCEICDQHQAYCFKNYSRATRKYLLRWSLLKSSKLGNKNKIISY